MKPHIPEHRYDTTYCSCCCCCDWAIDRDGVSPDAEVATPNRRIPTTTFVEWRQSHTALQAYGSHYSRTTYRGQSH
ncbi:hypothetical protein DPMN_019085 [Dreissena polymorpha]|uniref:Uncharacterized protein n=1 Tax=Dreissena polymorpha TaxID=45954 RepID=A0A9D4NIJ0_DREPO|nr:hypothetical protein DPMN_019085 [Dreissena polymorpha]